MRTARMHSEADIYHVVARGSGRQHIFENDEDRMRFLRLLRRSLDDAGCELYAWCLMSNHVHLLIHSPIEKVSASMKQLLGLYAMDYNARTGRVGHLFQNRFSSEPVNDDAYLLTVIRYIHQNPAKAGLARTEDYPWSSFREYVTSPRLCKTDFPLRIFGGTREFVRFHMAETKDTCLDIPSGRSQTRGMSDEKAVEIANEVLKPLRPDEVKRLEPRERNELIAVLKRSGLTVRQIERLTGVARGIIQRTH